jgi:hypothetical protein
MAAFTSTVENGSAPGYGSDHVDQPDVPDVTIALSVESVSISCRIQSVSATRAQANLLGKISPRVPSEG